MIRSHLKSVAFSFFMATIFLLSTAGSCDNSNTDNRPTLKEKYPETWDISFDQEYLKYDFSAFVKKCHNLNLIPYAVAADMVNYQGLILNESSSNIPSTTFLMLLNDSACNYPGTKPEVKFRFSEGGCRDAITKTYNKFDEDLCVNHTIKDAPKITKSHYVEFSAQTIKTTNSDICIKWEQVFTPNGQGAYMKIDKKGDLSYASGLFVGTTKASGLAVRKVVTLKSESYEILSNTIPEGLEPGLYTAKIVGSSQFLGVMDKKVYVSGVLDENLVWDSPMVAELNLL